MHSRSDHDLLWITVLKRLSPGWKPGCPATYGPRPRPRRWSVRCALACVQVLQADTSVYVTPAVQGSPASGALLAGCLPSVHRHDHVSAHRERPGRGQPPDLKSPHWRCGIVDPATGQPAHSGHTATTTSTRATRPCRHRSLHPHRDLGWRDRTCPDRRRVHLDPHTGRHHRSAGTNRQATSTALPRPRAIAAGR